MKFIQLIFLFCLSINLYAETWTCAYQADAGNIAINEFKRVGDKFIFVGVGDAKLDVHHENGFRIILTDKEFYSTNKNWDTYIYLNKISNKFSASYIGEETNIQYRGSCKITD
jgi:hypothetical protein